MSKEDWTLVSLLVHVPFVTAWIGLVLFDSFAAFAPGIADDQRSRLIARTRWIAVAIIAVIIVTGVWQTMENPFVKVHSYSALERLRDKTYGEALFFKHIFIVMTVVLTFLTRFILAPRWLAATREGSPDRTPAAGRSPLISWAIILNIGACFSALVLAARMTIELH